MEIQFWKFGLIWHNLDSTFLHIERRIHILTIHIYMLVDYITIVCTNSKFREFGFLVEAISGFLWIWAAACSVVHCSMFSCAHCTHKVFLAQILGLWERSSGEILVQILIHLFSLEMLVQIPGHVFGSKSHEKYWCKFWFTVLEFMSVLAQLRKRSFS